MSTINRDLQLYIGERRGMARQEVIESMPWYDLTITEAWQRYKPKGVSRGTRNTGPR